MTRLVLDTASCSRPWSPSRRAIRLRSGEIEMVACDTLLSEVCGGLAGRYIRDRITDEERIVIPAMLAALAVIVPDPVSPPPILQGRHAGVSG